MKEFSQVKSHKCVTDWLLRMELVRSEHMEMSSFRTNIPIVFKRYFLVVGSYRHSSATALLLPPAIRGHNECPWLSVSQVNLHVASACITRKLNSIMTVSAYCNVRRLPTCRVHKHGGLCASFGRRLACCRGAARRMLTKHLRAILCTC